MKLFIDGLMVVIILTNLWLLGSSRLRSCIHVVAIQGVLLGILPLMMGEGAPTLRVSLLAGIMVAVKGVIFPWLLLRTLRVLNVRREIEPFVGFTSSLLVGVGLLALSAWMGGRLPLPIPARSPLMVPLALFTIMVGLFAVISRRKALTQVLGYLMMENGIYGFGLAFAHMQPLLVELGTLLDVFMAVYIMGITIFNIQREFAHIDTDRLSMLKD